MNKIEVLCYETFTGGERRDEIRLTKTGNVQSDYSLELIRESATAVCDLVQCDVASTVLKDGHAIVSKSDPSLPVRRPTGRRYSSAATPTLSLGALEAPRRRLPR